MPADRVRIRIRRTRLIENATMRRKLEAGEQFPQLELTIEDGSTVTLPDDIGTGQAIVLFYRGHW